MSEKNNFPITIQVTYLFLFQINPLIFQNWCVFFFCFWKFRLKKSEDYVCVTVGWISQKILECDLESCYKNLSKIRNVS